MGIVCFGELIVDFISLEIGVALYRVEKFRKQVGGAPANVAVGLHFHGVPVTLWSKVGADSLGEFLRYRLQSLGLSDEAIAVDSEHPTKFALVGLLENGDRYFEFHNTDSAEKYIHVDDLPIARLKDATIFHFGGVALIGDASAQTTFDLLAACAQQGCLVSFDPNVRPDLAGSDIALACRLRDVLPFVDILKVSEDDLRYAYPGFDENAFLSAGVKLVLHTRGARGTKAITDSAAVEVPAPIVKVADTTGAGDAFMAALLSQVFPKAPDVNFASISRQTLREWTQFANQWAAKIVQFPGATSAYFATE